VHGSGSPANGGEPGEPGELYLISSLTKPLLGLTLVVLICDDKHDIDFGMPVKRFLPQLGGKTFLRYTSQEATIGNFLELRASGRNTFYPSIHPSIRAVCLCKGM
jgi:hypothetical protein